MIITVGVFESYKEFLVHLSDTFLTIVLNVFEFLCQISHSFDQCLFRGSQVGVFPRNCHRCCSLVTMFSLNITEKAWKLIL